MGKLQEVKQAILNPPPQRLAKTEYQSHFLNMLGVLVVSIILIYKGFWYIVFAFIFSIGVSYSQGVTAYRKYHLIKAAVGDIPIEQDKSPSRKRDRVIKSVFGKYISFLTTLLSIAISWGVIDPRISHWYVKVAFVFLVFFTKIILYYFIFYWIAQKFERR